MPRICSRLCKVLSSWKWVLGYTAFLLLTLGQTRRFLDWLHERNLSGLQAWFILFAGTGCLLLVLRRIRRTQGTFTLSTWLRVVGFVGLYLGCIFLSTDLTVDRIHFVTHGILGLLCFHAVDPRHGPVRRVAYAMAAVFAISFLDEFVQGLLASRSYALRDVVINLLAGFLPMLALFWLPLRPREERKQIEAMPSASRPRTGGLGIRFQTSDTVPVLLTLLLVCGLLWVGRVPGDLDALYGSWERENRCGRIERIRIGRDGTILWDDVAGGLARGRYRIGGNRLDGPLLEVEVLEGQGSGPCAWATAARRDRYYEVDTERLIFRKEREWPFRKIAPLTNR